MYAKGGFIVRLALMDKEFDKVEDLVGLLETNATAAREHVGEIGKEIRLIKERTRCIKTRFPYHWIPKIVVLHTIYGVCMWLNEFLPNTKRMWLNEFFPNTKLIGGLSPRELVTGRKLACDRDYRADIGAYIEATVDANITNGQEARTRSCISLGLSGNIQGSLKCSDLETGRVVIRSKMVKLTFPNRMLKKAIKWEERARFRSQRIIFRS